MSTVRQFRIHGDNVVECERALQYIVKALGSDTTLSGPTGSITCPTWTLAAPSGPTLEFTFLPGYGGRRWSQDIFEYVRGRGGRLREATDAVISEVLEDGEDPLFAFEFCGALPAGNQAWQRQGRAFSFAHAGIPYFYIAELGGFELAADRGQVSARFPNPAVPFSFFATSELHGAICLPVYEPNTGATADAIEAFKGIFGEEDFLSFIRARLTGDDVEPPLDRLKAKCVSLVGLLAGKRKRNDGLSPNEWQSVAEAARAGIGVTKALNDRPAIKWRKTAYIEGLTATARQLIELASTETRGLTSSSMPMSYVPADSRPRFAAVVAALYGNVSSASRQWLAKTDKDLAIAWVMGFKNKGEDARPDRGLPPLTRMLVGDGVDLMTFVYGPAPAWHWKNLASQPGKLIHSNGLWEAILGLSDAVLCDSSTADAATPRLVLKEHWADDIQLQPSRLDVKPEVLLLGEQDVDTALHSIFVGLGTEVVLEGMCNPPGGDWSGISFAWAPGEEHRWLTLPRVTAVGSKRPDHVFAVYGHDDRAICMCIESKENAENLEPSIGPRLTRYTRELFRIAPSVHKTQPGSAWQRYGGSWTEQIGRYVSVGAYRTNDPKPFGRVRDDVDLDIICALQFGQGGRTVSLALRGATPLGRDIIAYLAPKIEAGGLVEKLTISN
jgi:hypothetical protein